MSVIFGVFFLAIAIGISAWHEWKAIGTLEAQ